MLLLGLAALVFGASGCGSEANKAGGAETAPGALRTLTLASAASRTPPGQLRVSSGRRPGDPLVERHLVDDVRSGRVNMASVGARVFDTLGETSFQALLAPLLVDSYELERPSDFAGQVVGMQDSELTRRTLEALGAMAKPVPADARPSEQPDIWTLSASRYRRDLRLAPAPDTDLPYFFGSRVWHRTGDLAPGALALKLRPLGLPPDGVYTNLTITSEKALRAGASKEDASSAGPVQLRLHGGRGALQGGLDASGNPHGVVDRITYSIVATRIRIRWYGHLLALASWTFHDGVLRFTDLYPGGPLNSVNFGGPWTKVG